MATAMMTTIASRRKNNNLWKAGRSAPNQQQSRRPQYSSGKRITGTNILKNAQYVTSAWASVTNRGAPTRRTNKIENTASLGSEQNKMNFDEDFACTISRTC